jgi:hypothetical protein
MKRETNESKGVPFMRFDVQKIDERIQKLQEIRRIATDPQMATILLEFLSYEDDQSRPRLDGARDAGRYVSPSSEAPSNAMVERPAAVRSDETSDLVNEVVNGAETQPHGGLWSRRR